MKHLLIVAILSVPAFAQSDRLLDAIRHVESGGDCTLVGDGGKAIGPYQIHREYWRDAVEADKSLGGTYQDCRSEAYARRVVKAYLKRYGKNKSDEAMARIHNGGPSGYKKSATWRYWLKIQHAMEGMR
jgi:Destabilase